MSDWYVCKLFKNSDAVALSNIYAIGSQELKVSGLISFLAFTFFIWLCFAMLSTSAMASVVNYISVGVVYNSLSIFAFPKSSRLDAFAIRVGRVDKLVLVVSLKSFAKNILPETSEFIELIVFG